MPSSPKRFDCVSFQRQRREELARATRHLSQREFHAWVNGLAARNPELRALREQIERGARPSPASPPESEGGGEERG
jgi:hypothetical protein